MLAEAEQQKFEELLDSTRGIWPSGDGLEFQIQEREDWES